MRTLVVSAAWGDQACELLARTAPTHAAYAAACRYQHAAHYHPGAGSIDDSWRKLDVLLAALDQGHDSVLWLDCDVICRVAVPLPQLGPLERVAFAAEGSLPTACCGVWRATQAGRGFLEEIRAAPRRPGDALAEQRAVNAVLPARRAADPAGFVFLPAWFGAVRETPTAVFQHLAGRPHDWRMRWLAAPPPVFRVDPARPAAVWVPAC